MKRKLTRNELEQVKEAMKENVLHGLEVLWKILIPDFDAKGEERINVRDYRIPAFQAKEILAGLRGEESGILWVNWGPGTF